MNAARLALVLVFAVAAAAPRPADAAGFISSFTKTSTGSITYAVNDISDPQLAGSQSYGFALTASTSSTHGSVTLTAPAIQGTSTNKIPPAAFSAICTATSDTNGIFTSLGLVRLGASAVSCGQLATFANGTVRFTVTLYLDDTAASASAFTADTYASSSLTVVANAP
ncbi:MAG: hypothetical protein QOJ39_1921 [Candidatus Eremiobacteraeota bacterium]|jgi:hypothetical protein|nr:hypothetical protein [Candidatus Eremiobacteraeota bacterium]